MHEQKEDFRLKDNPPLLCTRENLWMQLRSLLRQLGDMDGAELEGVKVKEVHDLMTKTEHSSKVMSEELALARIRHQDQSFNKETFPPYFEPALLVAEDSLFPPQGCTRDNSAVGSSPVGCFKKHKVSQIKFLFWYVL